MSAPVLLVEDEEDDVFFFKRAMARADLCHRLTVVRDGGEGIEYLGGTGRYRDRSLHPLPCLVVLDLNLPQKHGLEVLQWIRQEGPDPSLRVVILTSSTSEKDAAAAHRHGITAYLSKPPQQEKLVELVRSLKPLLAIR